MDADSSSLAMASPASPSIAPRRRRILVLASIASGCLLAALFLAFLLSPQGFGLPLLPLLEPVSSQVLYRLRDASVFLFCTTAIAVVIFSSPKKDDVREKKQQPPAFEQLYPVASIFGDHGYGDADFHYGVYTPESADKKNRKEEGQRLAAMEDDKVVSSESTPVFRRYPAAFKEAYRSDAIEDIKPDGTDVPLSSQKKLHRRASSLDDGINFEAEPAGVTAGVGGKEEEPAVAKGEAGDDVARVKPARRVSFYIEEESAEVKTASPSRPLSLPPPSSSPSSSSGNVGPLSSPVSPGLELINRQADAFIARFKEQMRMQRLESLHRRKVSL